MNAHMKTIATILAGVISIWFLIYHPQVAKALYIGIWVVICLAGIVCIYSGIYCLFEPSNTSYTASMKKREMVAADIGLSEGEVES